MGISFLAQDNPQLLERKDVAFADVVNIFARGKESRAKMKAFIRENEQWLRRLKTGKTK